MRFEYLFLRGLEAVIMGFFREELPAFDLSDGAGEPRFDVSLYFVCILNTCTLQRGDSRLSGF